MKYDKLLEYLKEYLDEQTSQRLAKAIFDVGGINSVISLLEDFKR